MKYTITGYITAAPVRLSTGGQKLAVSFSTFKPNAEYDPERVIVREHSFEVEIPDDFDPRCGKLANLESHRRHLVEKFAKNVQEVDAQILAVRSGGGVA